MSTTINRRYVEETPVPFAPLPQHEVNERYADLWPLAAHALTHEMCLHGADGPSDRDVEIATERAMEAEELLTAAVKRAQGEIAAEKAGA